MASDLVRMVSELGVFRQEDTGSGSEGEESLPPGTEGSPAVG